MGLETWDLRHGAWDRANYRQSPVRLLARWVMRGGELGPSYSGHEHPYAEPPVSAPGPSRARRLLGGWSANFFQMILGVTQQVVLVPVFLHFWTSEVLAAWLVIYAAGNLALIADSGLQVRAINRFLAFKSCIDCDGRTASFYMAMLRIYHGIGALLVIVLLVSTRVLSPSAVLGFQAVPDFDAAFVLMAAGMLLTLPSGLVTALYRARGLYGRAVWLQIWAMLIAQLAQLAAIVSTGSLQSVVIAYAATQLLFTVYLLAFDASRRFAFLRGARARPSPRWIAGQFRKAAPFAVAGATELALNVPVLLVSALVEDRMAVAQWGLTRVVAGLLRSLCVQASLPLAAELGHDYAVGLKEQLRSLYARGSVFVTLLASIAVSGLLPFWPDFFALWTHGTVPYDPLLTVTLLIGTGAVAPSFLALVYANYSNRGDLLVRTKGLQLVVFLLLSMLLIRPLGPLGAAIAVVASDLLMQFGLLGLVVITQTLARPFLHVAFLAVVMILVTLAGWALGMIIRSWVPGTGLLRFACECTLWLIVVAAAVSPFANGRLRNRLVSMIPN
jgi:O-antigen/teichoic acid export membrane protein